jgi:pilus assembly protein CpaF
LRAIREQIAAAFDLIVQISRLVDGSRRITHITEALRMEGETITLQDVFIARPPDEETSQGTKGLRLLGPLQCAGLKPHFLEKMAGNGVVLPAAFFENEEDDATGRGAFATANFGGSFRR